MTRSKRGRQPDAVVFTDVELFILPRARFDSIADEHKKLAMNLLEGLARTLANRLRHTDVELRVLQEG